VTLDARYEVIRLDGVLSSQAVFIAISTLVADFYDHTVV
jgi:hypothetical protein